MVGVGENGRAKKGSSYTGAQALTAFAGIDPHEIRVKWHHRFRLSPPTKPKLTLTYGARKSAFWPCFGRSIIWLTCMDLQADTYKLGLVCQGKFRNKHYL